MIDLAPRPDLHRKVPFPTNFIWSLESKTNKQKVAFFNLIRDQLMSVMILVS